MSLLGLVAFITLAWGISLRRDKFPWRTVLTGMGLQFAVALLLIRESPFSKWVYSNAKIAADNVLYFAKQGTQLIFGPLAKREALEPVFGPSDAMVLGITICGTIILVAVLSSLLYHLGILQRIVRTMAWVMRRVMRTSGSESLCTSANVFMGQTEAPLIIQPYLKGMTKSELMTMMVGGMATIAGGVFAVYHGMGVEAGHLLTASFMAAPTALYMSKILLPETDKSETADGAHDDVKAETTNALDAMCQGASDGMKLTINVLAMLIGFTAVIALFNYLLVLPQSWAGVGSQQAHGGVAGELVVVHVLAHSGPEGAEPPLRVPQFGPLRGAQAYWAVLGVPAVRRCPPRTRPRPPRSRRRATPRPRPATSRSRGPSTPRRSCCSRPATCCTATARPASSTSSCAMKRSPTRASASS